MRIYSLLLLFCFSCAKSNKEMPELNNSVRDSLADVNKVEVDSSKLLKVVYHHTNAEGSYYDKEAYKAFGKWFDGLNRNYLCSPDMAQEIFLKERFYNQKSNPIRKIQLGPNFFYLYAHFLQKKNGVESDVQLREKILKIFGLINAIHRNIHFDGGVYFSHQRTDITAYAEYALNNYINFRDVFEKMYTVENQKILYIELLRQKVSDELYEMEKTQSGQYWYLDSDDKRREWKKETLGLVDELGRLIETYFDLKTAQEFQYSHYQ